MEPSEFFIELTGMGEAKAALSKPERNTIAAAVAEWAPADRVLAAFVQVGAEAEQPFYYAFFSETDFVFALLSRQKDKVRLHSVKGFKNRDMFGHAFMLEPEHLQIRLMLQDGKKVALCLSADEKLSRANLDAMKKLAQSRFFTQ